MEPVPVVPQPRRPGAVPVSGVLSPAGTVPVVTVFIQLSTPTPNKVQQHINLTTSVTIYLSNLTFFVAFKCRELLKLNKTLYKSSWISWRMHCLKAGNTFSDTMKC